ncbi:MAG: VCBS repeat-containing protein [Polyangiales bacterium]
MQRRAIALSAVLGLTACTGFIAEADPDAATAPDDAPAPSEDATLPGDPDALVPTGDEGTAVEELRRTDRPAATDTAADAATDARLDAATDVAADRPAEAAVDVPAPPPATPCTPAAGGGSATVRAPTLRLALRDMGTESWRGAPLVVDLDRDGAMEVVAAREQRVVVWRATGALRWAAQPGTARLWAPPVVGDFTGDANLEVVVASGDRVAMYTAAGAMAPGFPVRWRDEVRGLAGGDLDGDGRPEIVATTTNTLTAGSREDVMTAFRGTGAVLRGFPPNTSGAGMCDGACSIAGAFDQNLAIGRLDDDALMDVVAPTDNAYVSWHRGTGEAFPASTLFRGVTRSPGVRWFTDYANAQQGYANNESTAEQAHFTNSSPAVADIDGDGRREIVVVGSIQNAAQTDRQRGVGLFVFRSDGTRPTAWLAPFQARTYLAGLEDLGGNIIGTHNEVTVADLDPASPGLEMVFAGYDGKLYCVGADRSQRWSFQFTTARNQLPTGALVADLSGDGRPEVVFATYSTAQNTSALFVLSSTGAQLHRIALPGRGAMATPAVGDLDRDGTLEIVVNLKDATAAGDEALVYNVPASAANCAPWPVARRTALRDGYVR